jgi:thiol-disulfide isomerase/thioredoxin
MAVMFLGVFFVPVLTADPMPDHSGKYFEVTFTDLLSGAEVSTADKDHSGGISLVVFWSGHCSHCLNSLPVLNALHTRGLTEGFRIIGFPQDESSDEILLTCRKFGIAWPQNPEPGSAFEKPSSLAWDITRLPGFLLLDGTGKVLDSGFTDPEETIDRYLR